MRFLRLFMLIVSIAARGRQWNSRKVSQKELYQIEPSYQNDEASRGPRPDNNVSSKILNLLLNIDGDTLILLKFNWFL